MAAEEGLVEDSFQVPALLLLVRRAPGPEVRPPGEAKSHTKTDSLSDSSSDSNHYHFSYHQSDSKFCYQFSYLIAVSK